MQITEIRWQTETSHAERSSYRVPVRRGITLFDLQHLPYSQHVLQNLQLDFVSKRDEKCELFQASSILIWQFLLEEQGRPYRFSSDQDAPFRENFFRRAMVGDEGLLLGEKLDSRQWFSLKNVLPKLSESRSELVDPLSKRGRVNTLLDEFNDIEKSMAQHSGSSASTHVMLLKAEEEERQLAALEKEDKRLSAEQQTLKLLAAKSEYEQFLALRDELKATEEREGQYGSRITSMGHEITVHDLSELAAMRNALRDTGRAVEEAAGALEAAKRERMKAEQQRILLRRAVSDMEELRERRYKELMEERMDARSVPPVVEEARPFPTLEQLMVLLAVLLFAAGLYASVYQVLIGILLCVASVLFGGYFMVRRHMARMRGVPSKEVQDGDVEARSETALRQLDSRIAGAKLEWEEVEQHVLALEREETKWSVEWEVLGRTYRRGESELLRVLRRYAGPSEIDETDAIIGALSRQRDSSAHYNETVAELLQQIAEIRHGRSDEEMLREYDRACETLYGEMNLTQKLSYDAERARQVFNERLQLAEQIDAKKEIIRSLKDQISHTRNAQVTMGSLSQQYEALSRSLDEARVELYRLDASIAWGSELDSLYETLDPFEWVARTGDYINRLLGRRSSVDSARAMPERGPRVRTPRLAGQAPPKEKRAIDEKALMAATPELRYLAARLALAGSDPSQARIPLLLIGPVIRRGIVNDEDLFNTLVEWTLETGNQLLWFTADTALVSIAKARNINCYSLTQEREDS